MALNTLVGWIIKPKEAFNICQNPSFETNLTGWTVLNGLQARVRTDARRGIWSNEITPNSGVQSGAYYLTPTLTPGTWTFSIDVHGVAGQPMRLEFRDNTGVTVLATQTFTANGYWQRIAVAYVEASTITRRVYLTRDSVASIAKFYIDGAQVEAGNESTYFDGDMKGFLSNVTDYKWMATRHGSSSWRSGNTKHGGEMVSLSTIGTILAVIGLGMAPVENIASQWRLYGADYQKTNITPREFVVPLLVSGSGFTDLQRARKTLVDLTRPDAGYQDQPLTLQFEARDTTGTATTERLVINAFYSTGLEGNIPDQKTETIPLTFKAYLPLLFGDGERSMQLSFNTALTTAYAAHRDESGTWDNAGVTSFNIALPQKVRLGPDGYIYVTGGFSNVNGIANTRGIAKYDRVVWTPVGPTGVNAAGAVWSLTWGPDGKMYIGGTFADAGGVPNTANIATWDGSVFASIATGGANGDVLDMRFLPNGDLIVVGGFTTIGGVAANGVARLSNGVWTALTAGAVTGTPSRIEVVDSNTFFIGGNFTQIGGLAYPYLVKWDTKAGAYSQMITQTTGASPYLASMLWDVGSSRLYIGLSATSINNVATDGIGYLTINVSSAPIFTSMSNNTYTWGAVIKGIKKQKDGSLLVYGSFPPLVPGGVVLYGLNNVPCPDGVAVYRGGQFYPYDADFPGTASITDVLIEDFGDYWYLFDTTGTATVSKTTGIALVNNNSSARSYPKFVFTGPGKLYRTANESTKQAITYNDLTLLAGEVATLNLEVGNPTFVSSFRGNLMPYVIPGSSLDLYLRPGLNNINLFINGTTGATDATMLWRENYWSNDGGQR